VDVAIVLAVLDVLAVLLRLLAEPPVAGVLGEQPELPAEEALAPVGPGLRVDRPAALLGVEGEPAGVGG